ncbi:capsid cement protein [Verrucosispora sp. TAA-831]|uniref:capsid cement protein n=1 Tax=Verrucosispora sp. TAA-831 TaxID=3422227 RepID=UPI003D6FDCE6
MGAYEPEYLYSDVVTATFSANTTGKQLLVVTGNGTVGPSSASSAAVVGVAAHDVAANADGSYYPRGKVHRSTAAGAITAGARVESAAAGAVASASAGVNNVGIALTTAADTAEVLWMEI